MARIYFTSEVSAFSTFSAKGAGAHCLTLRYAPIRPGEPDVEIWSNQYKAPASGLTVCDLASIVELDMMVRGIYAGRYTLRHEYSGGTDSETYAVIHNSYDYGVTAEEWLRTHFLLTAHHTETVHAHRLHGMPPLPTPLPEGWAGQLSIPMWLENDETAKVTTTYIPEDSEKPVTETVTEYLVAGFNELTLNPAYSSGKSPMLMTVTVGERRIEFMFEQADAHAGLLIEYRNPFNHKEAIWLRGEHSHTPSAESMNALFNRERRILNVRDTSTFMLTSQGLPHRHALAATWLMQRPMARLLPITGAGPAKGINITDVSGDVNTSATDLNTIKLTYQIRRP